MSTDNEEQQRRALHYLAEHGTSLCALTRILVLRDSRLANDEVWDLLHDFALNVLPRALENAGDSPELDLYVRRRLRGYLTDRARTSQHRELLLDSIGERDFLRSPSIDPARGARATAALDKIEPANIPILRDYAAGHSVRAIAEHNDLSRYAVEEILVDSLLVVAAILHEREDLTRRELEAARAVLIDGYSKDTAARRLGVTIAQLNIALESARQTIRLVLTDKSRPTNLPH